MLLHGVGHLRRVHVRHETDRKLARHLVRDHRLGARLGKRALDAVKTQARVAHAAHEHIRLAVTHRRRAARALINIGHLKLHVLIHLALLVRKRRDLVVQAWDQDLGLRRHERRHDLDQVRHRLVHHASKHTAVQIMRGTADRQLIVGDAAQTMRHAGLLRAEPVVVRNAHGIDVLEQLVLVLHDKLVQADRAALLHPLEAELEVHRHIEAQRLVRLQHIDPPHNRALVVRRAAADQAIRGRIVHQLKRLRAPAVRLERRLHVIVAIHKHRLLRRITTILAHNHGRQLHLLPIERLHAQIVRRHVASDLGELVLQPRAHLVHLGTERRIARHTRDLDGLGKVRYPLGLVRLGVLDKLSTGITHGGTPTGGRLTRLPRAI